MNNGGEERNGESDDEFFGNVEYEPLQRHHLSIQEFLLDDLHT